MKKALSFIFAAMFLFCTAALPASADSNSTNTVLVSETVEKLEDGSEIVTVIYEEVPAVATASTTYTKTGSATTTYKNSDGDALFALTTHGTFTVVSGVSATCTSASVSTTIYESGWSVDSKSASKSGNQAKGTGTFKKKVLGITVDTKTLTCTLTCSVNGVLS